MAYDESLDARVRGVRSPVAGFSEKKMFGGPCFLIHGNMCCGVLKDELEGREARRRAARLILRVDVSMHRRIGAVRAPEIAC